LLGSDSFEKLDTGAAGNISVPSNLNSAEGEYEISLCFKDDSFIKDPFSLFGLKQME
jgi:hypothetical protein